MIFRKYIVLESKRQPRTKLPCRYKGGGVVMRADQPGRREDARAIVRPLKVLSSIHCSIASHSVAMVLASPLPQTPLKWVLQTQGWGRGIGAEFQVWVHAKQRADHSLRK